MNVIFRTLRELDSFRTTVPKMFRGLEMFYDDLNARRCAPGAPAPLAVEQAGDARDVDEPEELLPEVAPVTSPADRLDIDAFNDKVEHELATYKCSHQLETYSRAIDDALPCADGLTNAQKLRRLYETFGGYSTDPRLRSKLKAKVVAETKLLQQQVNTERGVDNGAPLPLGNHLRADARAADARVACRCPRERNAGPCKRSGTRGCINTYGEVAKNDRGFCAEHCLGFKMLGGWDPSIPCQANRHPRKADETGIRSRMYPTARSPSPLNVGAAAAEAGERAAAATAAPLGAAGAGSKRAAGKSAATTYF